MSNARWATKDEVVKNVNKIDVKGEIKYSGLPIYGEKNHLYIDNGTNHNLIIGSMGSGKTEALILPMLNLSMKAKESFIINDVKGEIYEREAAALKENGYEVYVLNFNDSTKGNNWNPLKNAYDLYKNGKKDKALDIIEEIGYYLLSDNKKTDNDPFWTNSATDYFTGLVLYLFENAKEDQIHLSSIYNLSNEIDSDDKAKSFIKSIDTNTNTYSYLSGTLNSPYETRASIISVFASKIKKYVAKESLTNMLCVSDFEITEIVNKPTAIFIITGISSYSSNLVPLFISEVIHSIQNNQKKLNIFLDEFDELVPINNFSKIMAYSRGLHISFTVTIRSYIHLLNMYSKEEVEILKMCFGNIIYLLSDDIYTLEEISKACGNSGKNIPLISVEELKTLNVFEAIVLLPRTMPFKTKLLPNFKLDYGIDFKNTSLEDRKINKVNNFSLK